MLKGAECIEEEWRDLFELIHLGHYDVTEKQIQEGITFYNSKARSQITKVSEIKDNT